MKNTVSHLVCNDFLPAKNLSNGASEVDLRAMALGRMPVAARKSLANFTDAWADIGLDSWWTEGADWWSLAEKLGEKHIRPLLNAEPGTCIMVPSVTHVTHQLLSAPELGKPGKNGIVTTDLEYPTIYDALHNANHRLSGLPSEQRAQLEFQLHPIVMGPGQLDPKKIIEHIDKTTAMVFLTHVASFTGQMFKQEDLAKIAEAARTAGAIFVVDGSQAITSARIDVEAMNPDIYTGTLLKQGCGGPGNAYVYVRPGLELTPTLGGWVGTKEPFTHGSTERREPSKSIPRRFFGVGTPAIAPLYHATQGLEVFERIGHDQVVYDVRAKARYMIERFRESGLPLISPSNPDDASNLIALDVSDAAIFVAELFEESGVKVVGQENVARMAPHIYHTTEEIERAIDAIINKLT